MKLLQRDFRKVYVTKYILWTTVGIETRRHVYYRK